MVPQLFYFPLFITWHLPPIFIISLSPSVPWGRRGESWGEICSSPSCVYFYVYVDFLGLRNGVSFFFFLSFVDFVSFSFFFFLKSIYSAEVQTFRRLGIFQLLLHLALSAFDTIGVFFDKAQVSMLEHSPSAIGSCVMYFPLLSVLPKKERKKRNKEDEETRKRALFQIRVMAKNIVLMDDRWLASVKINNRPNGEKRNLLQSSPIL